jgi:hypothetical protein
MRSAINCCTAACVVASMVAVASVFMVRLILFQRKILHAALAFEVVILRP